MKKTLLLLSFLTVIWAVPVLAEQSPQTITLKDGTTIKGQLINVSGGSYMIDSATMGQVKVSADQISTITNGGAQVTVPAGVIQTTADGKISESSINTVKTNMMQDPQIMSLIQELVKDPEIAAIMKDPSLMQDALSMDPQRIQNNPDVQKLMQNPTMQKILQITAEKLQNSGNK